MGRPSKEYTKEEVLKAIDGCFTIMATVAKRLNCDWRTARKYVNKWNETRQAYDNENEMRKDFAEGQLAKKIKDGDISAIKYFLSKKAKDRGYGDDPMQIQATTDNVIKITIDD